MDVEEVDKQKVRAKIEKLKKSKFKQQTLAAWRPAPTAFSTFLTFTVFSIIFLAIGIVLYVMTDTIFENSVEYQVTCYDQLQPQIRDASKPGKCRVDLDEIQSTVQGPVYVYYQLENYYQNHRRYFKSRDSQQLAGQYKEWQQLSDCDPIIKVGDLWDYQKVNVNGDALNDTDPAIPCGLIAKSFFNDSFTLWDENGNNITINDQNIAWPSDKQHKFKNMYMGLPINETTGEQKTWQDVQWIDLEKNEHLMVWMRTAGLSTFRKIWGTIDGGLPKGRYYVEIDNQFDVKPFNGKKSFILTTTNALGGKNFFLSMSYICVGTMCLLFAFIFFVATIRKQAINTQQV